MQTETRNTLYTLLEQLPSCKDYICMFLSLAEVTLGLREDFLRTVAMYIHSNNFPIMSSKLIPLYLHIIFS